MTHSLEISHPIAPPRNRLAVLSWLLLGVWLIASAAAFWTLQLRDWHLDRADATFDAIDVARVEQWHRDHFGTASSSGTAALTFIHLYKPGCRCNRYAEPLLQTLIARYQTRGVRFLAAPSTPLDPGARTPLGLPSVDAKHDALVASGIDSAPTALIFDKNGRLMHYGPYSDSAWCGSTGISVQPVLDRALSGLATVKRSRASRGCFCGW